MLTDIQNKNLADKSYWVDSGKIDADYRPLEGSIYNYSDDRPSLGQFQVLAVEDNQTNGMQVMAVAPVVNGVVDYNHITIAYAGTRFTDGNDLEADFNSVVLGQNIATERFSVGASSIRIPVESQVDTALTFAADIRERYPNAHISTTGHSLGGYLASMVAIKNRWAFTVFNAPNSANMLTKSDIDRFLNNFLGV